VATAGHDGQVRLVDAADGSVRRTLTGDEGSVGCVAYGPDGKTLVSGCRDGTLLVWDLTAAKAAPPAEPDLKPEELEALWRRLQGDDAVRAYRAVRALAGSPRQAVPFLAERVAGLHPVAPERVARLIAELDANEFEVREKATAELQRAGPGALPAVKKALEDPPSPEVRKRLQRVREALEAQTPTYDLLTGLRGVQALEYAGTPEARAAVKELAQRAADPWLKEELGETLIRLERRP
jgi:WD domain, G-beta repeat